jgi:adenylate cyclase
VPTLVAPLSLLSYQRNTVSGPSDATTEIERAFVAPAVPAAVVHAEGTRLRQGYVARDVSAEVRVRISADAATLTVKSAPGLSRTEVEVEVPIEIAEGLWPHTEGRRLEKTRYRLPVGEHTAEVDVYEGDLAGLCRIEVEFTSEDEARSFVAPDWFGDEVTGDPRWGNASLAIRGRPDQPRATGGGASAAP